MNTLGKTLSERILHAILYELFAMLMLVPLGHWLLGHEPAQLGVLALMLSSIAMSWNMLFNALFERLEAHYHWQRTVAIRCLHAVLFEGGLVFICIPAVAWWLAISLWQALLIDIGVLLFFLPYTYAFNWCYDHARARWHPSGRQST